MPSFPHDVIARLHARRSAVAFSHCVRCTLLGVAGGLALSATPAHAQHRAPVAFSPPAAYALTWRSSAPLLPDPVKRSFTPPRRYLVAFVVGALVGSRVAGHYAKTTAPEQDGTYGILSTARAIPIIFLGTVAGGAAGITFVWLVDSVRRPPRYKATPASGAAA